MLQRVAARVVVLDLEVVVAPQALRQHQIVRLVAAREQAAAGEAPGDAAVEEKPGEREEERHGPEYRRVVSPRRADSQHRRPQRERADDDPDEEREAAAEYP